MLVMETADPHMDPKFKLRRNGSKTVDKKSP